MKQILLASFVLISICVQAQTIKTVGPGQQYLTINQAYASIPTTITGAYEIHLMAGYSSLSETFPIVFNSRNGSSATNTITIMPQVANLVISTAASNTIEFDGCSYLIIDGSVAGVQDTANLKILNTGSSQFSSVLFKNGAEVNSLRYCEVMSANTSSSSEAAINFLGGSSNNSLENNVMHSLASNIPYRLIESEDDCNSNQVVGNYFFDARRVVELNGECDDWLFSNNHIYEGQYYFPSFIRIAEGSADITNNYYGGKAPFCTGDPCSGGSFLLHQGQSACNVSNNTIKNWLLDNLNALTVIDCQNSVDGNLSNNTFQDWHLIGFNTLTIIDCPKWLVDENVVGSPTATSNIIVEVGQDDVDFTVMFASHAVNNSIGATSIVKETGILNNFGFLDFRCIRVNNSAVGNLVGSVGTPQSISINSDIDFFLSAIGVDIGAGFRYGSDNIVSNIYSPWVGSSSEYGGFAGISLDSINNCIVENIEIVGSATGFSSSGLGCFNSVVRNLHVSGGQLTGISSSKSTIGNTVTHLTNTLVEQNWTTGTTPLIGMIVGNSNSIGKFENNSISNLTCGAFSTSAQNQSAIVAGVYTSDFMVESVSHNTINDIESGTSAYGIYLYDTYTAHFAGNSVHPDTMWISGNEIDSVMSSEAGVIGIKTDYVEYHDNIKTYISDNRITNLNGLKSAVGIGVSRQPGNLPTRVYSNLIENLESSDASVIGISYYPSNGNAWVEDNVIQQLYINQSTSSYSAITGIKFSYVPNGFEGQDVKNNLIQVLVNRAGGSVPITGVSGGYYNWNNVIRLGVDDMGEDLDSDDVLIGMEASLGQIYHNTIYLSGTNSADTSNSYCYKKIGAGIGSVIDNILINDRSNNLAGSGKHFTYSSSNILDQTINYNIHQANGIGGALVTFDNEVSALNTLVDIQNAMPGQNLDSYNSDPLFVNPNGGVYAQNMSLNFGSVAYNNGVYLASVTDDYYHATRSFTPTIGAIENLTIPCSSTLSVVACESYTSPSGNYTWTQGGSYLDTIPNQTSCDSIYLIDLVITSSSTSTIVETGCNSYTSPSGNQTWTSSGSYTDVIPNAVGCDSTITIELTIATATSSTVNDAICGPYVSPSGNSTWTAAGTYTDVIPNAAGCDSTITFNLTSNNTISTVAVSQCGSYTSPSGNHTWTSSGTYIDVIPNNAGCDSIITFNLTINHANTNGSVASSTITANQTGAIYQWLDCNDSYAEIAGATQRSYTATENGSYAFAITQNGCTDTSNCYTISGLGIENAILEASVNVYPNPAKSQLFVNTSEYRIETISIFDEVGKLIVVKSVNGRKTVEVDISGLSSGLYLLKIETEIGIAQRKLVIEN
ncbi:MAG: T9SS type A sorting domain-containing protein [Flavobacteriales bacterium]|nr:T9SS type A sorting domain-containing protein [Flavobacteriales bacterium]